MHRIKQPTVFTGRKEMFTGGDDQELQGWGVGSRGIQRFWRCDDVPRQAEDGTTLFLELALPHFASVEEAPFLRFEGWQLPIKDLAETPFLRPAHLLLIQLMGWDTFKRGDD